MPYNPMRRGHLEPPAADAFDVENVPRFGTLKNFPNTPEGRKSAYRFGCYILGVIGDDARLPGPVRKRMSFAEQRCKTMGIPLQWKDWDDEVVGKVSVDKVDYAAGFLVPDEFSNVLIDLREKYGVIRRNANVVPMSSDTKSIPRRRSGVTTYYEDEGVTIPDSDMNFDRVKLTARKLTALTKLSSELEEDAVLNMADTVAADIAWAFANREDSAGFLGDSTSTYAGITGICTALKNVSATPTAGTIADVLGIYQTSATSWATISLANMAQVVSLLPEFADVEGQCKWYCSRAFFGSVMMSLSVSNAGNRASDIQGGAMDKQFLGYPVEIAQVMPRSYVAAQIPCLFGNLNQAVSFGERRQTTIAVSEHRYFEQDLIAIKGTERYDVVVHDVGEKTTGTPRDAVMGLTAGPVVGLMMT